VTEPPDYGLLDRLPVVQPLFYPMPDRSRAHGDAEDLRFEVAPGVGIAARYYRAATCRATMLYFHGNGEVVGEHDDLALLFRDIGIDLVVVDYRGYGRSDGEPSFAAMVADAHPIADAFHAAADARRGPGPRFVMGRSLGGHPSLEIAARRPGRFDGLVLSSPSGELRRVLARIHGITEPSPELEALVAAHDAKLATISLPTLVIHGEQDEIIPLTSAKALYDRIGAEDRTLVTIPGAGHNDILWVAFDEYFGAIRELVTRHGG
jgi:alpha-beta hydrolase superfamily lysophospholipase